VGRSDTEIVISVRVPTDLQVVEEAVDVVARHCLASGLTPRTARFNLRVALSEALANAIIQLVVPDQLRGRVMGFYAFVFVGLAPIGSFGVGALAERIGTPAAVAAGGALSAAAVIVAAWLVPELRTAG
jgi:hypothetical protein